jgi:hypothetical protein
MMQNINNVIVYNNLISIKPINRINWSFKMSSLLMPKATAVWLIDNTTLTFEQISEFCNLHVLEVQAIADGDVGQGILGFDPILNGQLTQEEIDNCCKDSTLSLKKSSSSLPETKNKNKGPKYIPLARRGDKPDAIAWIVKNHPEVKNNQISKLIGTTKDTIEKIRTRSHWNISNITAKHPVLLSLCSQDDLENAIVKAGGSIETNSDES